MTTQHISAFQQHYTGYFTGILRWHQLDELWEKVKIMPEGWYIYFIGESVPLEPVPPEKLHHFIQEIDKLLREEHRYDYCGIVYVDNKETPAMIKIYDPNHLGASCGSSGHIIPPRWLLTRRVPETIIDDAPLPASRKRWWQRLFDMK